MVVSKNTRILIFAILSFFTFPATAGNVIKEIEGTVTDSSGTPLEGATVMIFASPRHCNTDSRGHYHLEVADGDNHVYVYYPGMEFANIYRKTEQKELNITLIKRKAPTVKIRKTALNTAWYNPTQKHTTTYCNPLNIEYNYEPYNNNVKAHGSFRSAADPMALIYKNQYLLFATNQGGYFYSDNLSDWQFRQSTFQRYPTDDDVCAPAAFVSGDTLFYTGSTYEGLPVWYSTHPETGRWTRAIEKNTLPSWDPCLFLDDDGKLYLYYGSSNDYPIKAVQLSREDFAPISKIKDVIQLYPKQHGWERFGKNNDDSIIQPFVEGAYMTKHNGKYYLQYGAPGTEFKTYADGVYVGDNPLGPFTYQKANPFSYKPGGFIKGSGHGGTFQDMKGNYWHVSTCMLSQKYKFERRIALYPAGFDQDNIMYCSTAFGDYPTRNAEYSGKDRFTGWMLLSYHKPVEVSSTDSTFKASNLSDEDIRTAWSASTGNAGEYAIMDLMHSADVKAIQVNFYDNGTVQYNRANDIYYQYRIWASNDKRQWTLVVDKSNNDFDAPHDYIPLLKSLHTQYLKIENIHVPGGGKFCLSDLRIFGHTQGNIPKKPENFHVTRNKKDPRNAMISWRAADQAYGYQIYYGIAPDKLYNCITVNGNTRYNLRGLDKDTSYYFAIQTLSESGYSTLTKTIRR